MIMKKRILFFSFFLLSVACAFAQGGPPPPDPGPVDDIPLPIDNHTWIAILIGISLGIMFLKSRRTRVGR